MASTPPRIEAHWPPVATDPLCRHPHRPATIAVLGSGLDNIYPRAHAGLAAEIVAAGGAVVSEHERDEGPRKHHFPARNRIVSGLCLGVVIVEASDKSGSLITARLALEQGRDVMAVPSLVSSPAVGRPATG